MKMGFDLDGVVVDGIREIWNEAKNIGLIPDGITYEDMKSRMDEMFNISEANLKRILSEEVYIRMSPIQYVLDDVRRWREDGHQIVYITARMPKETPNIIEVTKDWLDRYDVLAGTDGVIHSRSRMKWKAAKDMRLDIFVDDSDRSIRPMMGVIPHPFLLAVSYNDFVTDIRRWNWEEIRAEIDRLASGMQAEYWAADYI